MFSLSFTCSPAIAMINWSVFASSKLSCVWKGEENNRRDKAKLTFRTWAEVSQRGVEAPVRPSAPQLVCPVRTACAGLTGLRGSLITSRCAVAKPTGQKNPPLCELCCNFFTFSLRSWQQSDTSFEKCIEFLEPKSSTGTCLRFPA